MAGLLIAIVGSVDPSKTDYQPPLENTDLAGPASERLGKALADAGLVQVIAKLAPDQFRVAGQRRKRERGAGGLLDTQRGVGAAQDDGFKAVALQRESQNRGGTLFFE